MALRKSPLNGLRTLTAWAMLTGMVMGVGSLAVGCGGSSTPPPADTSTTTAPPPPPPPAPVVQQSQEPTAADVAAARPKGVVVDPFTHPSMKTGIASATPTASATPRGNKIVAIKPAPTPEPVKTPPTPPTEQAVGIFNSTHGPEAILSNHESGSFIVSTGVRLKDGGFVKSIDPVSRKVVIDKENTDFVLPLEAPAGAPGAGTPPSATGK